MYELLTHILPELGVAGVAVYFMYRLTFCVIKKYSATVSNEFKTVGDKISELSNRIDKLNFLLDKYLEVRKNDCVYGFPTNDNNNKENMGDNE